MGAVRLELPAKRLEIVDLAVEDDDVTPIVRAHRLVTGRREIDDRQPAEPERYATRGVDPATVVVWAAMDDRRGLREHGRGQCILRLGG